MRYSCDAALWRPEAPEQTLLYGHSQQLEVTTACSAAAADMAQPVTSSCTAPYESQPQHSHAKSATLRSSRLHTLASAVGGNTLQEIPDQQFCFLRRAAALELRVCGSKCFDDASEWGSVSGSLDSFPANSCEAVNVWSKDSGAFPLNSKCAATGQRNGQLQSCASCILYLPPNEQLRWSQKKGMPSAPSRSPTPSAVQCTSVGTPETASRGSVLKGCSRLFQVARSPTSTCTATRTRSFERFWPCGDLRCQPQQQQCPGRVVRAVSGRWSTSTSAEASQDSLL